MLSSNPIMPSIHHALTAGTMQASSLFPFDMRSAAAVVLDLTEDNQALSLLNLADPETFEQYIQSEIRRSDAEFAIGRYGEDRVVYRHSPLFSSDGEPRSIHLGLDLFAPAGTQVLAPLDGCLHGVGNNGARGDYGPTVILRHEHDDMVFHTLYGHLDPEVLGRRKAGDCVREGQVLGFLGEPKDNGGWPPHLHFQIITDLGGARSDFPGVAAPSDSACYLALCPDPNLLLRIPTLAASGLGNLQKSPITIKTPPV